MDMYFIRRFFKSNVACKYNCLILLVCVFNVSAQNIELPNPRLTPGAVDMSVNQDNIHATVCVRGYTDRVRPDKEYTNRLKHDQLRHYHYSDVNPKNYEEDHLIPLNIGGSPSDSKNLWPQPRSGEWSSEQKNDLEFIVYKMVCRGEISLHEAQQRMATDWIQAYKDLVPSHRYLLPKHRRDIRD
jgi:hypothetical protein